MDLHNNNNHNNACQPGLGVCGASVSSSGRLIVIDLIGVGNRLMVRVRQEHIVPDFPRLANICTLLMHLVKGSQV